jgi:hypothetical protein
MKHGATAFHFFCGRSFEHKIEDFIFENVFHSLLNATMDGANVSSTMGERPLHFLVTGGMDLKVHQRERERERGKRKEWEDRGKREE